MFRTELDHGQLRRDVYLEMAVQRAEKARLLREAGIERRSQVSKLVCRALCGTGRVLVAWGRTLEHRYEVPSLTLEKQTT